MTRKLPVRPTPSLIQQQQQQQQQVAPGSIFSLPPSLSLAHNGDGFVACVPLRGIEVGDEVQETSGRSRSVVFRPVLIMKESYQKPMAGSTANL